MRNVLIVACVFAMCALLVPATVQAKTTHYTSEFTATVWNPETGETIDFDVKYHAHYNPKSGVYHSDYHGQGESDLGIKYQLVSKYKSAYKFKDPDNWSSQYMSKFKLTGQGPSNNYSSEWSYHAVMRNGELKVYKVK